MSADRKRVEDLLRMIYQDKKEFVSEQSFIEYYLDQYTIEHETHVWVKIHVDFPRGGEYSNDFVISDKEYSWLIQFNPEINLGEVNGKHSEVIRRWNDVVVEDSSDYYIVEENRHKEVEDDVHRLLDEKADEIDEWYNEE